MADPKRDHGFVYNDQGQVDITHSPFFDINPEVDQTIEEYVERIVFTLAATIDDQISSVQWQIVVLTPSAKPDETGCTNEERLDAKLKLMGWYGLCCKRVLWRVSYAPSRIGNVGREKNQCHIFDGEVFMR
ncbi:hypothetical protein IEQ34_014765 [Dendrobium chrysotoxum]|uniref:Uncharacterized protein n=1 Tax=Dendrobium chrysotoxum TaxID=161865 RepID=A0AAV7GMW7_DENCH|nr:hypothetical protein IEQ34_014765 [Dendrobium chrysotoxum]